MTAPVQSCQPKPAELRRDPPVCCYCDNDLSCGHCGMEQPYDDISLLKSRLEQAERAVEVLESKARIQAKLLADTGRRAEEMEGALRFYRDGWDYKTSNRIGLTWKPKEELLDDCGELARAALEAKPAGETGE